MSAIEYKFKEITEKNIRSTMRIHAALGNGFQEVRRVDFFVEQKIMVEIKAIIELEKVHLTQAKNYLEAYNMQAGLLINFGSINLQFKRLENLRFIQTEIPINH